MIVVVTWAFAVKPCPVTDTVPLTDPALAAILAVWFVLVEVLLEVVVDEVVFVDVVALVLEVVVLLADVVSARSKSFCVVAVSAVAFRLYAAMNAPPPECNIRPFPLKTIVPD